MSWRKSVFCVISLILLWAHKSPGQTSFYNLNINNGLPSSHIYSTITDKYGYMWIATANGVARYNGYEFKVFSSDNGLPTSDIWQLVEDDRGAIWLGSISDRLGYILNKQYKNAFFKDTSYHTLYPRSMCWAQNKLFFGNAYLNGSLSQSLCIANNDTVYTYDVLNALSKLNLDMPRILNKHIAHIFINTRGEKYALFDNSIYKLEIIGGALSAQLKNVVTDSTYNTLFTALLSVMADHYIISYFGEIKSNYFYCLDVNTGQTKKMYIDETGINENILSVIYNPDKNKGLFYIITKNYAIAYSASGSLRPLDKFRLNDFNIDKSLTGGDLLCFGDLQTWGQYFGTATNGLYFAFDSGSNFKELKNINLSNYTYCGTDKNKNSIWWNTTTSTLCKIKPDHTAHYIKIAKDGPKTKVITPTMLNLGNKYILFDTKDDKVYSFQDRFIAYKKYYTDIDSPNLWYIYTNFGFSKYNQKIGYQSQRFIDKDHFDDMQYDSTRNTFWAYNKNKILLFHNKEKHIFTKNQLAQFGVQTVDQICVDQKYGNIFIKGGKKLILYNPEENLYEQLFPDLNFKEANITIYNNILTMYGRFGVLFSKISGKRQLSGYIAHRNIKDVYYSCIYGAHVINSEVLLNTDKGTLSLAVPDYNSLFPNVLNQHYTQYKIICYTADSTYTLGTTDTVAVTLKNPSLRFDVINPFGNGKVSYTVAFNNKTIELNGDEFNIPYESITPDNYYSISIAANDKVWQSQPVAITIYITPKWYQTKNMIRIIWVAISLTIILLITSSILITKKLVLNAAHKRNLRMELELRSIYAQINPHFIFNSLNSALLLVSKNKTDEAYNHISKFSRLLRSYIKSSRNKLILLSDEIKNLTNYIDLQQVRFKDKFNYEIIVAENVTPDEILIPSLLLQPFVENAIEHGLLQKESTGNLIIRFDKEENKLLCIIDDNGIGRKESKLNKIPNPVKDESYGELLIKDLVNIFNKYEHMNIHVSYTDKIPPNAGTIVTIQINIAEGRNN